MDGESNDPRVDRTVTATELARAAGRALDDLDGQVVPVTRHGKVVAILRPVGESALDQFQTHQFDAVSTSDISVNGVGPTLDRVRRGLPVTITRYNRPAAVLESPDAWDELHGQLARLDDADVLADRVAVRADGTQDPDSVESVARGILTRLSARLGSDDPIVRATAADLAGLVAAARPSRLAAPAALEQAGWLDLDD